MAEYMLLFRSSLEGTKRAMGTPEAAQKSLAAYLAWIRTLEEGGHLKQRGRPLDPTVVRVISKSIVTDGPFAEAKDIVIGYITIEADDIDHAVDLARGCPMAQSDAAVEIRPVMASVS